MATSNPADFKVKNGLVVNTTATFLSTVNSTSTTTGGVIVSGGVAIVKDLWVGGNTNIRSTTSATNTTSGALQVVGGVGIQGDLYARNLYSNGILIGTNAGNATTSTNLAGGSQYQIPYQSTSSSTVFILPPPTSQNSLLQFTTGTGFTWTSTASVGGGTFFYSPIVDTFTSAGTTTTYTLSTAPTSKNILTVVVDGVTQLQSAFNLSGTSLIFTEIPYNGANIDVHYANVLSTSTTPAAGLSGQIQYNWNGNTSGTSLMSYNSSTGAVSITSTVTSASTVTGALIVSGGVGIGGNLYVGGDIVANKLTIQLTTVTTTLVTTDDIISTYNTTPTNSTNTGALQIGGGAGFAGSLYVGGVVTATTFYGAMSASHSTGTGILGSAYNGSVAQTWSLDTSTLMARAVALAGGTAGQLVYQSAPNTSAFLSTGTQGQILVSQPGAPAFTNTSSFLVGYSNNLAGGSAGQFVYQSAANTTAFVSTGSMYVYRATIADSASGGSSQVNTVAQPVSGNYYPTFVNANNASAAAMSVYTTSSFVINPSTGFVGISTSTASRMLEVLDGANSQLRLTRTAGVYTDFQTDVSGNLNLNPSGGRVILPTSSGYLDVSAGTILLGPSGFGTTGDVVFRSTGAGGSTISPVFRIKDSTGSTQDGLKFSPTWTNSTPGSLSLTVAVSSLGFTITNYVVTTSSAITTFVSTTSVSSTNSGALQVVGGVGIGGGLVVGGTVTATNMILNGYQVSTSSALTIQGYGTSLGPASTLNFSTGTTATVVGGVATIQALGAVVSVTGGTDTVATSVSGAVTVWNTSTLQSITNRGATTTNIITITNATAGSSTITGALVVTGGIGIGGNFYTSGLQRITNGTAASSTTTGALVVTGGVGIGGSLYAGNIYTNGSQILPTNIQEITATGGQTTFTITGGYTVGSLQVFANGVNLGGGDFTASNGTTVTVNIARAGGDVMRFVSAQTSSSINNINALAIAYAVTFGA